MSKTKTRPAQSQEAGIYKPDAIKDVAELYGLTSISDTVASMLASDVEYRIHQIVEEAARFMRHGRRTCLSVADVEQALRVLNIEPLYGHLPHQPSTFKRALPFPQLPAAGTVYYVDDEDIDFDRVLREEKIALPKGVSWTAHWLAVEGVQPLIPENPPAVPRDADAQEPSGLAAVAGGAGPSKSPPRTNGTTFPLTPPSPNRHGVASKMPQPNGQQQLVKQVLSRELQLYYTRLTSSLLPPSSDTVKRTAALASLRHDAGLQALLPYLIRWVGEGVVGALKENAQATADGRVLEVLLDVLSALLENSTLFVEPYLHQILPPILSILLHSSLPTALATHLRTAAAQTLARLLTQHSTTYPSLPPRIMKTLLLALVAPGKKLGSREGAIRGLMGVGKEAVRKGLVESGGAAVVARELAEAGGAAARPEAMSLETSVMDAFRMLYTPSDMPESLSPTSPEDGALLERMTTMLGDRFASILAGDAGWARGVMGNMQDLSLGR